MSVPPFGGSPEQKPMSLSPSTSLSTIGGGELPHHPLLGQQQHHQQQQQHHQLPAYQHQQQLHSATAASSSKANNARNGNNDQEGEPKKKKARVSTACENCRRRKTKCCGTKPTCAACQAASIACEYDLAGDRRKPYTKDIVVAMQLRIETLEKELAASRAQLGANPTGAAVAGTSASGGSSTEPGTRPQTSSGEPSLTPRNIPNDLFAGGLALNAYGELRFYGPTSSYRSVLASSTSPESLEAARAFSLTRAPHPKLAPTDPDLVVPRRPPELSPDFKARVMRLAFDYCFAYLDLVPEKPFYHDLQMFPTQRTHFYSTFLLNTVLAIGCRYLDPTENFPLEICSDYNDRSTRGDVFISWARYLVDQEWHNPTMSTIRGLLCMSVYLTGRGLDGPSRIFEASAMCLTEDFGMHLGLHRLSLGAGGISNELVVARRNTFFAAFGHNVIGCMYLGRTPTFAADLIDQVVPPISSELDYEEPLYRSSAFQWASRLILIADRILSNIYALRSGIPLQQRQGHVPELNLALQTWYHDLPSHLRSSGSDPSKAPHPHIILLNLLYYVCVIQLHRPFVKRVNRDADNAGLSTDKCMSAANHVVRLVKLQRGGPHGLRFVHPVFHYACFLSGTILALSASEDGISSSASNDADRRASASSDLKFLIASLREMAWTWTTSETSATILEAMIPYSRMGSPQPDANNNIDMASWQQQQQSLAPVTSAVAASLPLMFPSWDLDVTGAGGEPHASYGFELIHSLLNPMPPDQNQPF